MEQGTKIALQKDAPGESVAFPAGISLSAAEMEGVRRRFLADALVHAQKLIEDFDHADWNKTRALMGEWARAASLLDFAAVARLARTAERILREPLTTPAAAKEALENLVIGLVEPPEASAGRVPDFVSETLGGKAVALVGFHGEEGDVLYHALERASARPRLFTATAQDSDDILECSLIIVKVAPDTKDSFLLTSGTGRREGCPLILAGARNQILALDGAVQLRAEECLIDGWQPEEALMRAAYAFLRRERSRAESKPSGEPVGAAARRLSSTAAAPVPATSEILIADDDLTVRLLVRSAFQAAGLKCRLAANGNEAMQMMREFHPAVAVLDVNMPGMDGYEVLAAARGESIPTRVLLLTARQQEADITRAFQLGADDYVVKPFNPNELIARVRRFLKE